MNISNLSGKSNDWAEYYDLTRNLPPRPLLVKALEHVKNKNKALDIGGGALKDTRYLLHEGFDVTVIDKAQLLLNETKSLNSDRLHAHVTSFEDFDFGERQYDIAAAMFALPFNPPESFDRVFQNIKRSLVEGGVFCGQFFGIHDTWASNAKMTFHTKEQVEKLLDDMEIIQLTEKEEDGTTANGTPKHWHVFYVIAKKR